MSNQQKPAEGIRKPADRIGGNSPDDETRLTEIEIAPDGRIFLFGASRQILELLRDAGLSDPPMRQRLA